MLFGERDFDVFEAQLSDALGARHVGAVNRMLHSGLPLGARFAIHAGQGLDREAIADIEAELAAVGDTLPEQRPGVIVCTVQYAGWLHEDGRHSDTLSKAEARAALKSDWWQGPYAWVLRDPQPAPDPIGGRVYSGLQGLWRLESGLEPRVRAART